MYSIFLEELYQKPDLNLARHKIKYHLLFSSFMECDTYDMYTEKLFAYLGAAELARVAVMLLRQYPYSKRPVSMTIMAIS